MKTHKEKVQEYVIKQVYPKAVCIGNEDVKMWVESETGKVTKVCKVEGLHHYLAVLVGKASVLPHLEGGVLLATSGGKDIGFSLTTGQPATEKDWEILANIFKV